MAGRAARVAFAVGGTMAAAFAAKAAALRLLSGRPPVELLGGSVRLALTENTGAFLGLGQGLPEAARRALFVGGVGVALLSGLAMLLAARGLRPARTLAAAAMIGGGLANLLDRLPDGRVTDYVVLSAGPLRTGVFNLADAAILAGAVLWALSGDAGRSTRRAPPDGPSSDA